MADEIGGQIPPDFVCPITQELMRDPVIALDGHSYERDAITQWFGQGRIKSPLTNAPLGSRHLTPNHTLRKGKSDAQFHVSLCSPFYIPLPHQHVPPLTSICLHLPHHSSHPSRHPPQPSTTSSLKRFPRGRHGHCPSDTMCVR